MSSPDEDEGVRPPSARQVGLSLFLLLLFAPVVLAVGSDAFRPGWLTATAAGVPISVLWVLGLILAFVFLNWLFARMIFAQTDKEAGR